MIFKQGDTFLLSLAVTVDGVAQDCTLWEVQSKIDEHKNPQADPVADLVVTWLDRAAGLFTLSADTSTWPIGNLFFDIQYTTDSAQIITTDSVLVQIIHGETGP